MPRMSGIVTKALAHLKELEETMKNEDVKFSDEDISNIDEIADCLQQLENEVKASHEQLETQTIVGSVLRHKLAFYPKDIKKEIDEAVRAAKASNDEVVQKLNIKLDQYSKELDVFNKRDHELSKLIAILQPKKEDVEAKNLNIINMLNQRMSDKAQCQIRLNETRDTLRETLQANKDTEEDIIVQKENLMKYRSNAREEKAKLEEDKYTNNEKSKVQEEKNSIKQNEVNNLEKELKITEEKLRTLFRDNERIDESIVNLEKKINEGETEFEREKEQMNKMLNESLRLTALDATTQQDYSKKKAEIIEKTKTAKDQIETNKRKYKDLKEKLRFMEETLKEVFTEHKRKEEEVGMIYKMIDDIKDSIGKKLQEMISFDTKNKTIYEELAQMEENYNSAMESAQHEIEELRDQIAYEREEKAKKQQERDVKLAEIEAFQTQVYKEHTKYNSTLAKGKSKYNEYTAHSAQLEKNIKDNELKIQSLTNERDTLEKERERIKMTMESKKETLQKTSESLLNDIQTFENDIGSIEPGYLDLVSKFTEMTRDYEETKRTVILTKSKKSQLEDQIESTKMNIEDVNKQRETTSQLAEQKRKENLSLLKRNNMELKQRENEILNTGLRRDQIHAENLKFEEAIDNMEKELEQYERDMSTSNAEEELYTQEYKQLERELIQGWKSDDLIRSEFKAKDLKLISNLNELLERTSLRESKLYNITDKIYKELEDLNQYLSRMAAPTHEHHTYTPPRTYDSITLSERATTANTIVKQLNKSGVFNMMDDYSIIAKVGTPDK